MTTNTGNNFVNESKLGAFPLEVRGCATLYDSLSAATYSKKEPGRRQSLSQDSIHEVRNQYQNVLLMYTLESVCTYVHSICAVRLCCMSSSELCHVNMYLIERVLTA